MGHKKVGVPSRRYTGEFKIEAVKLGHSVGMSEASRRLGIPDSSLFNWVRLERAGKLGTSAGLSATPRSAKELEAEVDRLRRELASAKVDNEILKNVWSAPEEQGHSFRSVQPVLRQCIRPVDGAHWLLALMEPARIDPHKAFGHVGPHF